MPTVRSSLLRSFTALVITLSFFASSTAVRAWGAWRDIERVEFDLETLDARLPSTTTSLSGGSETPVPGIDRVEDPDPEARARIDTGFDVFLIIGSDLEESFSTADADAILLAFRPQSSADSYAVVSIPRDLAVTDPCSGKVAAVRFTLRACDLRVTGPEVVAAAIERLLQIDIDHFVSLQFSDFRRIIDRLGGVRLCVDRPVSLANGQGVFLEAGCTTADGAKALEWMRNRTYLEMVDGQWVAAPVGALDRDTRQQELLLALLPKLKAFRSAGQVAALIEEISAALVIDRGLGISEATDIALEVRDLQQGQIVSLSLPVRPTITQDGRRLLTPNSDPAAVIAEALGLG